MGLRAPNLAEAQAADRTIWTAIYDLVNEEDWGLEDALHEITVARSDLKSLMQPRPRAVQVEKGKGKGHWICEQSLNISRARGARRAMTGARARAEAKRVNEAGGNLCDRYNTGHCQNPNCKYVHRCNKMIDGTFARSGTRPFNVPTQNKF